jgi:predicted phosphodiesterase
MALVLLHLSDIHFSKLSGGVYDLDEDLRHELELDAVRMREKLGEVDAVLVTGDIAYSGQQREYEVANEWLRRLTEAVGCEMHKVWVTPGNHDVTLAAANSPAVQALRLQLLNSPPSVLDEVLARQLSDSVGGKLLFEPLSNYNEFADQYGCRIDPSAPFWQSDLRLNDGWILRLRGLNSTLTSDKGDVPGHLILGAHQVTARRHQRVAYLTLCHHTPSWFKDEEEIQKLLNSRVQIQLFGHEHAHNVTSLDETLVVVAGAVHPKRGNESWKPRYNWLVVEADENVSGDSLNVTLYSRIWNPQKTKFEPEFVDENDCSHHRIVVEDCLAEEMRASKDEMREVEPEPAGTAEDQDALRQLGYQFFNIPYLKAMRIAGELGLAREEDKRYPVHEQLNLFLERASQAGLTNELKEYVERGGQEAM